MHYNLSSIAVPPKKSSCSASQQLALTNHPLGVTCGRHPIACMDDSRGDQAATETTNDLEDYVFLHPEDSDYVNQCTGGTGDSGFEDAEQWKKHMHNPPPQDPLSGM